MTDRGKTHMNKPLMQRSVLRMFVGVLKDKNELIDEFEFLEALLPHPSLIPDTPETTDERRSRLLEALEAIVE